MISKPNIQNTHGMYVTRSSQRGKEGESEVAAARRSDLIMRGRRSRDKCVAMDASIDALRCDATCGWFAMIMAESNHITNLDCWSCCSIHCKLFDKFIKVIVVYSINLIFKSMYSIYVVKVIFKYATSYAVRFKSQLQKKN